MPWPGSGPSARLDEKTVRLQSKRKNERKPVLGRKKPALPAKRWPLFGAACRCRLAEPPGVPRFRAEPAPSRGVPRDRLVVRLLMRPQLPGIRELKHERIWPIGSIPLLARSSVVRLRQCKKLL